MISHRHRETEEFLFYVEYGIRHEQPIPRPRNRREWRALTVHFPAIACKMWDQHKRLQCLNNTLAELDRRDAVLQVRYRRLMRVMGFLIDESVYREHFTGEDTTQIEKRIDRLSVKLQRQQQSAGNVRTLSGLALWAHRNPSRAAEVGVAW